MQLRDKDSQSNKNRLNEGTGCRAPLSSFQRTYLALALTLNDISLHVVNNFTVHKMSFTARGAVCKKVYSRI